MSGVSILLNDARGVYIPKDFTHNFDVVIWGIAEDDANIAILQNGPENELYWEAWDNVINRAEYTDSDGNVWRLHQDGDLFAYCENLLTEDESVALFGWDVNGPDEGRDWGMEWYDTSSELA